jgi:biotin carboxyl carrier protein
MSKVLRRAAGLAAAGAVALVAFRWLGGGAPARADVEIVRRGDLTIDVPASGVLTAERSVNLTAPISSNPHFFRIARLAPEGTVVKPGDTLMELEAQEVKRQIEDDGAEAGKTKDQRAKRQLEYDLLVRDLRVRIEEARVRRETAALKNAVDAELLSAQQRREFQLELEQATQAQALLQDRLAATEQMGKGELAALDQTLANIGLRLERTRALQEALVVKAPIAGTLVYKVMADGAKRKVGEQTCHHEIILQLPDLSTLRVQATVNEQHAGSVQPGQVARIRLDALPDATLTGRILEVGTALRTTRDNPIKLVDVVVQMEPTDLRLNPGMTASMRIEVERVPGALLAPLRFVYERDGRVFTRVRLRDGRVEERAIRPGPRNDTVVQVLDGVSEGETLASEG